ncbi:cyclic nucleotide-binding domain-containing protein [Desulfosediminicola sp.]|uniref:cyclic nucleotide-binding domain-containing protein n=1 Tax=Desulfosediminicola sp. TaxID=2886825 RepID=UPI003AF28F1E
MVLENDSDTGRRVLNKHFADLIALDTGEVFSNLTSTDKVRGEHLFTAGEEANSLYMVAKGCFAVHRPVGIGKRTQAVALLSTGALAGEAALFAASRHGSTMIAVEDSQVLEFPRHLLEELEQVNPQLYVALLKKTLRVVSQRLQKSSERLALIL